MANDVLEVFDGTRNVEFKELTYCAEAQAELPVFTIIEPSAEEWNQKAMIQNTKMFTEIMGRKPISDHEVRIWIYSHKGVNHLAG